MKALSILSFLLFVNLSFANIPDGVEPGVVVVSAIDNTDNSTFVVKLEAPNNAGIVIYDDFGCEVFSLALDKEETTINLKGVPSGDYTLEIQNNGYVYQKELILF